MTTSKFDDLILAFYYKKFEKNVNSRIKSLIGILNLMCKYQSNCFKIIEKKNYMGEKLNKLYDYMKKLL